MIVVLWHDVGGGVIVVLYWHDVGGGVIVVLWHDVGGGVIVELWHEVGRLCRFLFGRCHRGLCGGRARCPA